MRFPRFAALLSVLALAAAPAVARAQDAPVPPLPSVTLPPEMDRVLRDYERLWAAGDAAGLAGIFTEDGFVLQNGRPPVRGREAIQRAYADARGPLRLRALGFAADGDVGYIIGAYAYGDAGPDDMGKFTLTLRREPGGPWRIASDIDNMNRMPRMGPPPAARAGAVIPDQAPPGSIQPTTDFLREAPTAPSQRRIPWRRPKDLLSRSMTAAFRQDTVRVHGSRRDAESCVSQARSFGRRAGIEKGMGPGGRIPSMSHAVKPCLEKGCFRLQADSAESTPVFPSCLRRHHEPLPL